MNKYRFIIGGLHIEIRSDFPLVIQKTMQPFWLNDASAPFEPELFYDVTHVPFAGWKPDGLGDVIFRQAFTRVYRTGKKLIVEDGIAGNEDYTVIDTENRSHIRIYVALSANEYYNIASSMAFPSILPAFNRFFIHASFIRVQGSGILFTAPSGTGKSTQASLWERLRGADILNGDKTLLHCPGHGGQRYAFGSPWAGSSGIFRDEKAPLRALVVLRQAPQNSIERMQPFAAFKQLFSQSGVPLFDAELLAKSTEMLEQLVNEVPVFLLKCLPDEGAVNALEEALQNL